MEKPDLESLKDAYKTLLGMCKRGDVRVSDEALKKANSVDEFCRIAIENHQIADFYLTLFGLQKWFAENCPPAPDQNSDDGAERYVRNCIDLISARSSQVPDDEITAIAEQSVAEYAAHFSGKLIHSIAQGASLVLRNDKSSEGQPHVYSRRLAEVGVDIPLDQTQLDNSGIYQRVLMVLNGDLKSVGDMIPDRIISAILAGVQNGLAKARQRHITLVDRRLRQIIVPSGDAYIAISPLPSAGISTLVSDAAERATADLRMATYSGDESSVGAENITEHKHPQKNAEGEEDEIEKKFSFSRIKLNIGGAIPRNATALWKHRWLQHPLHFRAPQRNDNITAVTAFVHSGWRPWIRKDDAVMAINCIRSLGDWNSVTAANIQAKCLFGLVQECHAQAVRFSADLDSAEMNGDRNIEDEVKNVRSLSNLDRALIDGSFDAAYRESMAQLIIDRLRRIDKNNPLAAESARVRVNNAIIEILERTK